MGAMLAAGYCGEAGFVNPWAGFIVGLAGWGYILYEIFAGEAGSVAATGDKVDENVRNSFSTMRFIVTAGWCIYPLGYLFGYLLGGVNDDALNLAYNLDDFVNKIAFCLAIWASAKQDTAERLCISLLRCSHCRYMIQLHIFYTVQFLSKDVVQYIVFHPCALCMIVWMSASGSSCCHRSAIVGDCAVWDSRADQFALLRYG